MSTFFTGAGSKLSAGLQANYFSNTNTDVDTKLNITSATFDPTVEKGSEETLLQSKIKNGSYLLSIGVDGSFDANLRPEMTDWLFRAGLQILTDVSSRESGWNDATDSLVVPNGYEGHAYTLQVAGSDPVGSTLVMTKGAGVTAQVSTYPGMTVRTLTLNAPNNDFVTVSCDLVGREEIKGTNPSAIPSRAKPATTYVYKTDTADEFTKPSYIVTNGIFKWNGNDNEWCIESSTLTIDNGIEDSPRCYQDGKYANIPVMGMRAVTFDFNTPYDARIEALKEDYLLTSDYGSAELEFTSPDDADEKVIVRIPNLSITSVGAGISGTGIIDASVSGEAVQDNGEEPLTIIVITKSTI